MLCPIKSLPKVVLSAQSFIIPSFHGASAPPTSLHLTHHLANPIARLLAHLSSLLANSAMATSSLAELEERVAVIERKDRRKDLFTLMKEKKDLLNAEMKSYSDNIIIKGMKFVAKEVQKDEESRERFRESALRVLVDQKLVPAAKLFVLKGDDKGRILRGVLRHAHPLGNRDNASVVVAFLESWFAAQINSKLIAGKKLTGGICIVQHMPPIIDALRNGALKARRAELAKNRGRKIVMKTSLKAPWIRLEEVKDGKATPIEFEVDDHRLINPPLTLAKMEQEDKDNFVLKDFLPAAEKALIRPGTVRVNPDVESELDVSAMELF